MVESDLSGARRCNSSIDLRTVLLDHEQASSGALPSYKGLFVGLSSKGNSL